MTVEYCVGKLNSCFQVRKTELIFLSSGMWTHNFKSRTSEMEFRILTVAWMQKECLLCILSANSTHIFSFGNLNCLFQVQITWKALHGTLGKQNQKHRPKGCSKHVCTLLGTILGNYGTLKFFDFLKNFQDSTHHGTVGNKFLSRRKLQNTFGDLGTILDNFRTLKSFWLFSWVFSVYLPQILSPKNRIQIS